MTPAQLANLTRAGGNRYAGKHAMIAVIRDALLVDLDDNEVRRWVGLPEFVPVTVKARERWATAKAKKAYKAILEAWARGMWEPIKDEYGKPGGVRIGGVMRIGAAVPLNVARIATDEYGQDLKARGVPIFQKIVPGSGWWQMYGYEGHLYGPVPSSEVWQNPVGVYWMHVPGQTNPVRAEWRRDGTKGADGKYRAWFYNDGGIDKRVRWIFPVATAAGQKRLKVVVPNRFLCELNGIDPEQIP